MKSFERLVLSHLKNITDPLLDPLRFASRANSSAFNTITPEQLHNKLLELSVPSPTCQWITNFLTGTEQQVRLGNFISNTQIGSTGAPQGCVLSPLLFSLYTNDCTSTDPSVKVLKYADDTTVIGLIRDGDTSDKRVVDQVVLWSSYNNLVLNTAKTGKSLTGKRAWVRFPDRAARVLSVWSLHVLPVSAWVSSGFSGFLPQSKDMQSG
ncbi:hypothetical protein AOLI_G00321680 [Acnodon oligacanthus]